MIKKVVFICGAGHSGSTLLGLLLGSHSKCFYLGEANKVQYLYNTDQPEKEDIVKFVEQNVRYGRNIARRMIMSMIFIPVLRR